MDDPGLSVRLDRLTATITSSEAEVRRPQPLTMLLGAVKGELVVG
jgi:hypothetical protein